MFHRGFRKKKSSFGGNIRLTAEIERLIVEATTLGLTPADLKTAIDRQWEKLRIKI